MFNPLKVLGRIGKGLATVLGITVATGGGIALSATPDLSEMLKLVLEIITALGVLLASFGIGRKSGYSATG